VSTLVINSHGYRNKLLYSVILHDSTDSLMDLL